MNSNNNNDGIAYVPSAILRTQSVLSCLMKATLHRKYLTLPPEGRWEVRGKELGLKLAKEV